MLEITPRFDVANKNFCRLGHRLYYIYFIIMTNARINLYGKLHLQGVMEVDEKGGVLPMHIPLALHDRFSMEVKDGEEISTVACT